MNCLFLDSASFETGSLACVADGKTLVSAPMDRRITDSQIVPFVEQSMKEAGWSYKDLTHIACATGPGGFTSLRTGVAFSNVLIDQLDIPAAGIHLSDLYEARLPSASAAEIHESPLQKDWIWIHSTRIDQCFIRGFGSYAKKWPEPTLVSVEEVAKEIPEGAPWAGELIPQHREKLAKIVALPVKPLAEILPRYLATLSFEKKPLLPWYGRGL